MRILKRALIILFAAVFLCLCFALVPSSVVRLKASEYIVSADDAAGDFDCILVFGCGLEGESPSDMLRDRLDVGIGLYNSGKSKKLLMSGDHGTDYHDEVGAMKRYAVSKGVPEEDIFLDHAGFSTYDSVYRAKEIFGCKKVLLVTQKYHLYRAIYISLALGLEAQGVDGQIMTYTVDTNVYNTVRETLARDKDFLKVMFKPESTYTGEKIDITGDGRVTDDKLTEVETTNA